MARHIPTLECLYALSPLPGSFLSDTLGTAPHLFQLSCHLAFDDNLERNTQGCNLQAPLALPHLPYCLSSLLNVLAQGLGLACLVH